MAAPQSNILNSEEDDFDYISRDKTRNNKNKLISSSSEFSIFDYGAATLTLKLA